MNNKKLYRNTNQQMFAGVCSGLADYFGLDVTVVRLIFVLLFFLGGNGILVYLLLWILTPVQPSFIESTAQDITPKQDE
ncbi:MAG: PspC family transcriptional regulator [Chloroflexi bacterium HGW-Chloroflexi-10]|nr:MAG: PspC family transcriptional regulator [Chloroflexi bacterium HGW-Chloroflexi-10]